MNKKNIYLKISTLVFSLLLTMVFALSISTTSKAASIGKVTNLKQISEGYDSKEGKYLVHLEYTEVTGAFYYGAQILTDDNKWMFTGDFSYNNQMTVGAFIDLTPGNVYYVRIVTFKSAVGFNLDDISDSLQVVTAPETTSTTILLTGATSHSLTASWTAVSGATGYDVYVKKYGDNDYTFNGSSTSTSYKISNYNNKKLSTDSAYYVRVCATKTSNTGFKAAAAPSNESFLRTLPAQTSKIKAADWKPGSSTLKITWSGSFAADGYEVQFYNAKNKSLKKADVKTNHYALSKAPKNSFCSVKVRPYIKTSTGKKLYTSWSKKTYFISQANMTNKKYTIGNGKLTLNWSKVNGASKYTIYAGKSSKKMKKVTTVGSNTTSCTLSKISGSTVSKNGTYYVKVVPQKKVNGKTYKGDYGYYYVIR